MAVAILTFLVWGDLCGRELIALGIDHLESFVMLTCRSRS